MHGSGCAGISRSLPTRGAHSSPTPSSDNQRCLQRVPDALCRVKVPSAPPVENHCFEEKLKIRFKIVNKFTVTFCHDRRFLRQLIRQLRPQNWTIHVSTLEVGPSDTKRVRRPDPQTYLASSPGQSYPGSSAHGRGTVKAGVSDRRPSGWI